MRILINTEFAIMVNFIPKINSDAAFLLGGILQRNAIACNDFILMVKLIA
jgi:hypothetical protein